MFFDNKLMHLARFYQKVPKLRASLKTDQNYTKKKKKSFLVKLMQNVTLALTLLDEKFLFPESLGEIFSSPRRDY